MSPVLGIIIMMNNYFHDVATAVLLAGVVALWVIFKRLGETRNEAVLRYFLSLYRGVTRLVLFSLVWIILGGIPRTIFYSVFEWADAAGENQVAALIVKHVLVFGFVGAGIFLWKRMQKKVRAISELLK